MGSAASPAGIRRYYESMCGMLELVPSALASEVASAHRGPSFLGLTPRELDEELRRLRDELDAEVTLAMLAAYEGLLMEDFFRRTEGPKAAPAARRLRDLRKRSKKWGRRVDIEEVLEVWREEIGCGKEISWFRQRYRHRHWLAHGRVGPDMSGVPKTDPDDIWIVGSLLLEALGLLQARD